MNAPAPILRKQVPIYAHDLPSTAWQLLWWMIAKMDEHGELRGGWRSSSARALKRHRIWIGECARRLQEAGLIETAKGRRYARVLIRNLSE